MSAASEIRGFQQMVRDSALSPVDRVIERHAKNTSDKSRKVVEMWKRLVAQDILLSENQQANRWSTMANAESVTRSYLRRDEERPVEPWFRQLFSRLERGTDGPHSIFKSPFWIWTFNYDRLVEHLFYNALMSNFDLTASEALKLVRGLNITHIHGDVGGFSPYGSNGPSAHMSPYGAISPDGVHRAASTIRPAHEALTDEFLNRLWEPLGPHLKSVRFAFLGFGFDRANIEKLRIVSRVNTGAIKVCHTTWRGSVGSIPAPVREVMESLGIRIGGGTQLHPSIPALLESLED
jgi:hypothetical protein